jgi:hypothetical protein
MIRRILGAIRKPKDSAEFEATVLYKLAHLDLLHRELEARRELLAAKQHALYCGQTLDDVLDPDWMSKPRKGLRL